MSYVITIIKKNNLWFQWFLIISFFNIPDVSNPTHSSISNRKVGLVPRIGQISSDLAMKPSDSVNVPQNLGHVDERKLSQVPRSLIDKKIFLPLAGFPHRILETFPSLI